MNDGVLVVDKPAGMTSHDVVDEIRKLFGTKRVGHAGTLDPDATGVLVLALGTTTKLLAFAAGSDKSYRASARFGAATTTQDVSGEVVSTADAAQLTAARIEAELPAFRGDIEQTPPMVSAVKVGGERLYRMARRGEEIAREPRKVHVAELELVAFAPGTQPEATFDVTCSAGTYVRTLVHDLGAVLGSGAHLTSLRRTAASGFTEADAIPLAAVGQQHVRPALDLVRNMARIDADDEVARMVANGRPLGVPAAPDAAEGRPIAVVRDGRVLAIYERRGAELRARRVIPR